MNTYYVIFTPAQVAGDVTIIEAVFDTSEVDVNSSAMYYYEDSLGDVAHTIVEASSVEEAEAIVLG